MTHVPSRHIDPERRLWVQPVCGCAPVELLEAANEELRRDRAEGIRIAYVAATRSRDILVAPVCGDKPIEGWLQVLDSMLYPQQGMRRESVPAPGCPDFGEDSVLNRGPEGHSPAGGCIRPGLHRPSPAGPDVVSWDPAVLPPEPEEHAPLRNQRVLEADSHGAAAASEANYVSWKHARETLLAQAARPTLKVQTITSLARNDGEEVVKSDPESKAWPPVRVETVPDTSSKRPGGKRFGAVVHAVLASIDLSAADTVQQSAAMNGRLIGATDEEIEAAITAVRAALDHPVLRRAAARPQTELRREAPVLMMLEDGSLAEGVIDLAFSESEPE